MRETPAAVAHDEAFQQELVAARHAMFEAAMNRPQPLAAQAVDTLALDGRPIAPSDAP
jgi:hypothetical protein